MMLNPQDEEINRYGWRNRCLFSGYVMLSGSKMEGITASRWQPERLSDDGVYAGGTSAPA